MATLRLFNSFSKWESVTHTLKTMLVLVQRDLLLVLLDMCFTLLHSANRDQVTNWFTYNSVRDSLLHTVNGSVWRLSWIYIAEVQWCKMIVQRRPSSADKLLINWWGSTNVTETSYVIEPLLCESSSKVTIDLQFIITYVLCAHRSLCASFLLRTSMQWVY